MLVAVNFVVKGGRKTLHTMRSSLVDGAKQAIAVGIACAIVGVIIGVLTLTGAASNFAGFILDIGSRSLFLSLFLTMIVCLILGMGIPTIPNYIITSAIAAPALLKLGVPLIVSHMFVFYFGIMADLTPPVALAAFAAASISKASPMKTGWKATHIAIAGFVIPYMAVYDPALMLQPATAGAGVSIVAVVYVVFKAIVSIGLWGATAVGYLRGPLNPAERAFAFVAAALLVAAVPLTDQIGFALAAIFIAWHVWRTRKAPAAARRAVAAGRVRRHGRACGLSRRRRRRARCGAGAGIDARMAALGAEVALAGALPRRIRCAASGRSAGAGIGRGHGGWRARRPERGLVGVAPRPAPARAHAERFRLHGRPHAVHRFAVQAAARVDRRTGAGGRPAGHPAAMPALLVSNYSE